MIHAQISRRRLHLVKIIPEPYSMFKVIRVGHQASRGSLIVMYLAKTLTDEHCQRQEVREYA